MTGVSSGRWGVASDGWGWPQGLGMATGVKGGHRGWVWLKGLGVAKGVGGGHRAWGWPKGLRLAKGVKRILSIFTAFNP